MKAFVVIILSYLGLSTHELVYGQQAVHIQAHEHGSGILRTRSGECFVITPAHVVQDMNKPFSIWGPRSVLSTGELVELYPYDLAIVRIIAGGEQYCTDWQIDVNYENILTGSVDGFLDIAQLNGIVKSMKVFLLEKDNIRIVIRPYFPKEQISKGMSGSSLYTIVNGKKVFLGMLQAIENPETGIILKANVMESILSNFFDVTNTRRKVEVAVITVKESSMNGFELAEKASEILSKQYVNYSFVPYEKGKLNSTKPVCEISEFTENDPENRANGQIHKYKTHVTLTVKHNGQVISRETLDGSGTDYSKENAQTLSIIRTLELTEKLKFSKR
ncbi:hypothetical protein [Spirosoma foliorum]|uniref:Trypsin-like peptidase domain-containing protein n=1 Tax=Spirosoma foliorum TaxID=2710596 RepID=A0A7G5GS75_9BACT|nr:hypothetical protein [Spirosoma foliorum]QMW01717.1 hypothetical protein H3H32_27770 [Spirosoma foliorum]